MYTTVSHVHGHYTSVLPITIIINSMSLWTDVFIAILYVNCNASRGPWLKKKNILNIIYIDLYICQAFVKIAAHMSPTGSRLFVCFCFVCVCFFFKHLIPSILFCLILINCICCKITNFFSPPAHRISCIRPSDTYFVKKKEIKNYYNNSIHILFKT